MEEEPSCAECAYLVQYTWIDGTGSVITAVFKHKSDAISYMSEHVDDNVNLEWSIRKVSYSGLQNLIE